MVKTLRLKLEMFVRARNFGVANSDVFPETSAAGKLFSQLAVLVASIEEELVRRAQARAEARKVNRHTRNAARQSMKAVAATGRRAVRGESAPHSFRMPRRHSARETLNAAKLLREEAERRQERFVALGMPPTFLAEYDAVVDTLAKAVAVQQDSRAGRRRAVEAIDKAVDEAAAVIADLDVAVPNALGADRVRIAAWEGARRMDVAYPQGDDAPHTSSSSAGEAPHTTDAPAPATSGQPTIKIAS